MEKALISYLNSLKYFKNLRDEDSKTVQTYLLLNLGNILGEYRKHEEAIEYFDEGIRFSEKENLIESQLWFLYSKAFELISAGQIDNAISELKKASSLANQLSDSTMLLKCFNLLGLAHKENKYYDEARDYYDYILSYPSTSNEDKMRAYHNIAITYTEEQNRTSAKAYFDQAIRLQEESMPPKIRFVTLYDLSEWHYKNGTADSAWHFASQAEALYDQLTQEPENFNLFYLMSKIAEDRNDIENSHDYYEKAFQESVHYNYKQKVIIEQKEKFEIELIISGFEAEQSARNEHLQKMIYQRIAVICVLVIIIGLIIWKAWFRWWRIDLAKSIRGIERPDSTV